MNAYVMPLLLIVLGGLIFAYGSQFPEYYDPKDDPHLESSPLNGQSWTNATDQEWNKEHSLEAVANQWYALKAKLQTPRDPCQDVGAGIIGLGIGTTLLFLMKRIRRMRDFRLVASPRTRDRFYLLAALTWLSFIPAEWSYCIYTAARGDYPGFADTIAIPMGGALILGVVGLPVVLFGVRIATAKAKLPVSIWSRTIFRRVSVVGVLIWIALILTLLVTAMGVTQQPPIVPSAVFTIYLLVSGKAATDAVNGP